MVDLSKLKGLAEWPKARQAIEAALMDMLGSLPKERIEPQAKTVDEITVGGYTRRRVNYFVSDYERVAAWMCIPEGRDEVPAIVCCHREVPQGKDESVGIEGDPRLAFAAHYAEQGYATIAPDCITAGERISMDAGPYDTSNYYKDNPRRSALGKMLWDHAVAIDVLCEFSRVDAQRIGVVGHGLGGANALLLAALDERVQVCVAGSGFIRFADDDDPGRWARDEGFVLLPKLRAAIGSGKYPLDWEHILAIMAPSPVLLLTNRADSGSARSRSCEKAVQMARSVYSLLGEDGAIQHKDFEGEGSFTQEALELADEWFERWV